MLWGSNLERSADLLCGASRDVGSDLEEFYPNEQRMKE